jgi:hypothetical protein
MAVNTAAGVRAYIGPSVADATDVDLQDFESYSYTEITEIVDLGSFGDSANTITHVSLGDRRVRKFKGSFDAGTPTWSLGRDTTDAGQIALVAAAATDFDYAFKIVFNDGSDGSPSADSIVYFAGKVMGYTTDVGNADSIIGATVNIGVNSKPIEIPAV